MGKEQVQMPFVDINFGNEGLPDGAKKFEDTLTAELLEKMWQQEKDFFNQTRIPTDAESDVVRLRKFELEISGPESSTFKGVLHPKVEGNSWYRGIAVTVDENYPSRKVIIFSGWMQPWIKDETQASIVYTIGEIPAKTVREVVYLYTSHILSSTNKFKIPNRTS